MMTGEWARGWGCGNRVVSTCSPTCRATFEAVPYCWDGARRAVFRRDGGICQRCGLDVGKLQRIVDGAAAVGAANGRGADGGGGERERSTELCRR